MKLDTNMLILLGAVGVGAYFLLGRSGAGAGAGDLSQTDMMIMQQLQQQQAAAAANSQAMMQVIQDMKAKDPAGNPWTNPETVMEMAKMGIQLTSTIIGAF